MKKILFCIISFFLFSLQVLAAENTEKTLYCSYIVGGTDLYFKLEPLKVRNDGYLEMNGKITGKVIDIDNDNGEIFVSLASGGTWSLEYKRMLSIYTKPLGDEVVYSFGSCVMKNNN